MTELDTIIHESADRGQNDAVPTAMGAAVAKAAKSKISTKLDVIVETYAQMFAHGQRTPILRRPD
ncbi:hypothetical protein [Brevibacterium sp. VCM10]|uniref:hypothetical protein n=1 Tax=Brevibacterium sp. VCM10 TaxID=1381751 RepID=UPI0012DE51A6|nr:hypothetical protein [Brevibacterium sp. VCM10]